MESLTSASSSMTSTVTASSAFITLAAFFKPALGATFSSQNRSVRHHTPFRRTLQGKLAGAREICSLGGFRPLLFQPLRGHRAARSEVLREQGDPVFLQHPAELFQTGVT